MEITRLTSASRELVMNVNGRSMMIACPMTFDLLPVTQFSTFDDMLLTFDANLITRI
jgi:hypothetical protein